MTSAAITASLMDRRGRSNKLVQRVGESGELTRYVIDSDIAVNGRDTRRIATGF